MLKVGLIGCGFMGMMHLNCYKAMADKVEIVALADLREEKTVLLFWERFLLCFKTLSLTSLFWENPSAK